MFLHIERLLQDAASTDWPGCSSTGSQVYDAWASLPSSPERGSGGHQQAPASIEPRQSVGEEFFANLAFMASALHHIGPHEKVQRARIIARAVNYLHEFAPHRRPKSWGWQANPGQQPEASGYGRIKSRWSEAFIGAIACATGLPSDNLLLVADRQAMAVLRDQYPTFDAALWAGPDAPRRLDDAVDAMHQVFARMIASPPQRGASQRRLPTPIVLDATALLTGIPVGLLTSPERISNAFWQVHERVRQGLLLALEYWSLRSPVHPRLSASERAQKILCLLDDQVLVCALFHVGPQPVLHVGRLANPIAESGCAAPVSVYPYVKDFFGFEDAYSPENGSRHIFSNAMIAAGCVAAPHQIAENWALACGAVIEPLLDGLGIKPSEIDMPLPTSREPRWASLHDFLAHPDVKAFAGLPDGSASGSPEELLPRATIKLLVGLAQRGIEKKLSGQGLAGVLQWSCHRMLRFMRRACGSAGELIPFLNELHLIHEEIANLLALALPYTAQDTEAAIARSFELPFDPVADGVQVQHLLKNSGMSCVRAVLHACAMQKKFDGRGPLRVAIQSGSYYEIGRVIQTLDGPAVSSYDASHVSPHLAAHCLRRHLDRTAGLGSSIDLFFAELHHGMIFSGTDRYRVEPLSDQVDSLFAAGLVASPFTVAIDVTVGQPDDPVLMEFLHHNLERISKGSLIVVVHRSAQKFDMLGWDNYCGGIMSSFHEVGIAEVFDRVLSDALDHVTPINRQGLTHLQHYLQPELRQMRLNSMARARRLNDPSDPIGFPIEMHQGSIPQHLIRLVPNVDPQSCFVHLLCDGGWKSSIALRQMLEDRASTDPTGFPLHVGRGSFGFNQSSFDQGRLSIGPWDSDAVLMAYRDFFVAWSTLGADIPNRSEADLKAPQRVSVLA